MAGTAKGYSRVQAVKFVATCLRNGVKIFKVNFDNKEIVPAHRESILNTAKLWNELAVMETQVTPGGARIAKKNPS